MISTLRQFYQGKRVLLTGVHGFKGAWLAELLLSLDADVYGVGLRDSTELLYDHLKLDERIVALVADIRSPEAARFIVESRPDVVIHLAAQPLVKMGYDDPLETYSTNVLGAANVLNAVRYAPGKVSTISVTTDKVYRNYEKLEGYVEDDELCGIDPYSNSKSCAELVTFSMQESFFKGTLTTDEPKIVSSARAGNVIAGGDFAADRIVPDLARALRSGESVKLRAPESVRPYQHALDVVAAYLYLAARQYDDPAVAGAYNVGPNRESVLRTIDLANFFVERSSVEIEVVPADFYETNYLWLNSKKFRTQLQWTPVWSTPHEILSPTFEWYDVWANGGDTAVVTREQIERFLHV